MDDAFGAYFPDTLESLENLGAELVEFSPLHDEALPRDADLVLIGCGFPDRHADELAANHSLIASLRAHVCRCRRLYAEGGGAAYLARALRIGDRWVPGAGILPLDAELVPEPRWPEPVERELLRSSWLGPAGTTLRGYRPGRWRLLPAPEPDDCPARSGRLTLEPDIFFRSNAIGSLVHLHLGAVPELAAGFASPAAARTGAAH
jgi:cobyrinic acid a,c-diamide synthase